MITINRIEKETIEDAVKEAVDRVYSGYMPLNSYEEESVRGLITTIERGKISPFFKRMRRAEQEVAVEAAKILDIYEEFFSWRW